jgi:hypothetical protein
LTSGTAEDSTTYCSAVQIALPAPPEFDRAAQRFPPAIFSDGNELAANLARDRTPGHDVTLFRLVDTGDPRATSRTRRWKQAIGSWLSEFFFLGVAPGHRFPKRRARSAMGSIREILRMRLPSEHHPGVPADAVPAGIIDPGHSFCFGQLLSLLHTFIPRGRKLPRSLFHEV